MGDEYKCLVGCVIIIIVVGWIWIMLDFVSKEF